MAEQTAETGSLITRLRAVTQAARTRRLARWLAGLILSFGVLGYFAGPSLLRHVLLDQASSALHRKVTVGTIDVNPYALSVRIHDFSVRTDAGHEVAGFDALYVNLSSFSLAQFGVVVDAVQLDGLRLAVARHADGRYDISDLLDEWLKPSDSPTPRFSVNNIEIRNGRLSFEDQPVGRQHLVEELHLSIPFVSSLPYQAEIVVEPKFSARIDGAPFTLSGRMRPFATAHASELDLDLDQFNLAPIQAYLPDRLPIRINSGVLSSELKAVFSQQPGGVFTLGLEGALHLSDLRLSEPGGQELMAWKQLDVGVEQFDLAKQDLRLGKVHLQGMTVSAAVNRQGELNWLRVAGKLSGGASDKGSSAASQERGAHWSIADLQLEQAQLLWRDESNTPAVKGQVRDLAMQLRQLDGRFATPVELVRLACGLDFGEGFGLRQLEVLDGQLDLAARKIRVASVAAQSGTARLQRNAQGQIEWLAAPQLKASAGPAGPSSGPDWAVQLGKFELSSFAARFEDKAAGGALQTLDDVHVTLEQLDSAHGGRGQLALDGRVNGAGRLLMAGDLAMQPFSANLALDAQALPLLPLQPYFGEYLNIALTRGQLSAKGQVLLGLDKEGLSGGYKGQLTLGDLLSVDKANSADFLKWKSLYLGGMDVRLRPMAVQIGEIALSDFYSRLIVNPEGTLNLQQIIRRPNKPSGETVVAAVPAEPIPLSIGKVTLQGGAVEFSDRFVKPNFSVSLTRVGGRVTGLSSTAGTLADMELRGTYANAAPVEVTAKLNPLAARAALDLKAEVRGVDMVGFSPYSGKYAGYDIEKGKLSLFLKYKLSEGQLQAENRIFLDQLTFGDKVNSPDATKLPVGLAVSLLKNSRGEIDINLPISGSLDDPQFSLGGIVVKVIINLFVKAVTSPFALLGSMFGGGEELSMIEFEAGRVSLPAAGSKRLESLAKALNERDSLKLEITAHVDPEADREGLKRVALECAVRAEKLKENVRKGVEGGSLESIQLSAAEYPVYLQKAYREARFPKPRNLVGLQKELPVEEMEKLMLTNTSVGEEDLRSLASRRAETVQTWLLEQGKVPGERIFMMPPKLSADAKADHPASGKRSPTRVEFSLR